MGRGCRPSHLLFITMYVFCSLWDERPPVWSHNERFLGVMPDTLLLGPHVPFSSSPLVHLSSPLGSFSFHRLSLSPSTSSCLLALLSLLLFAFPLCFLWSPPFLLCCPFFLFLSYSTPLTLFLSLRSLYSPLVTLFCPFLLSLLSLVFALVLLTSPFAS